uniref:Uncharacterized protein n=1 Tax=Mycena chlorophos TaxID=658473 RepID=A0ABQ0LC88_MYCCL|nr:predicted protein [Mycena chlorophos]
MRVRDKIEKCDQFRLFTHYNHHHCDFSSRPRDATCAPGHSNISNPGQNHAQRPLQDVTSPQKPPAVKT